ncbi:MAG TPA: hypothetical protein VNO26_08845 [Candidatus Limnocylindria bacterium]|nr:hypothetical protein [Candidatus Limnocylindria bacterium]
MTRVAPRTLRSAALAALLLAASAGVAIAHDGTNVATIPMQKGKVKLSGGGKPKVTLAGSWKGETPSVSPFEELVSLRVFGGFRGDSGALRLDPGKWEQTKKGWRYKDPAGTVGGVELVDLRLTKTGGKLKVKGGGSRWLYEPKPGTDADALTATLQIGIHQWCVQFQEPKLKKGSVVSAKTKTAPAVYESTWAGVQAIFERNGCLSPLCHGASPGQGELDLRPEVAYEQLVNRFSERGGKDLVKPGSRQDSFLWEKLAAATEGYDLEGRGSPMPSGGAPLTPAELEAIRLWIQFGAPPTGVIAGTEEVLGGCLPPAEPQKAQPAPPPAPGTGVQFHAPPWTIQPADGSGLNGEGEVCYATWYDIRDQVPDEFETPCPEFWGGSEKTCFYWNRTELTQDPNSHHSIIHIYKGQYEPTWQPSGAPGETSGFKFTCHGGPTDGQACDPRVADVCGEGGSCYGQAVSSIACIGYGPPDFGSGNPTGGGSQNAPSVGGSQQPYSKNELPPGVYGVYPIEGVIVWNSHAFNLFEEPVTNEQWWNVYFAPAEDRQVIIRGIFDAEDIFWCPPGQILCDGTNVPPFTEREFCRTITFPIGTRIFEFSSHTHERGRLFRIWGPGIAESCRASGPVPCEAEPTAPFFITTEYNDPTVLNRNDNPWILDDPDPAKRRFKFCAIYDNGFTNPLEVKRNSTSPVPPPPFYDLAPGGRCYFKLGSTIDLGISCLNGPKKGQPCRGSDPVWNGDHSVCDSSPGAGDGICDACPLTGGLTTDDEMFILLGSYYCEPGSPCETEPYTN